MSTTVFAQNVPEEAIKFMARGEAAVEIANSDSGYQNAITEFQNAINVASNWPAPYYNLAMVQEKMGKYSQAIANLNKYLQLDPNANDAASVKTKIYKLEYKRDNPVVEVPSVATHVAPVVSAPIAQPKNYSHLNGEWCDAKYQKLCFKMSVQNNTFTLRNTTAYGGYGLKVYMNYKGTIKDNGSIKGKYYRGSSFPNKCSGQVVWHQSPPSLLDGSRLYPGEEEMMLRYNDGCYKMNLSTCEGVDNCARSVTKMHLIRS